MAFGGPTYSIDETTLMRRDDVTIANDSQDFLLPYTLHVFDVNSGYVFRLIPAHSRAVAGDDDGISGWTRRRTLRGCGSCLCAGVKEAAAAELPPALLTSVWRIPVFLLLLA